jgi:PhzF family phenazine biosynthesis protein
MGGMAAEMNLSETAFLYPEGMGFNLRWFTPAVEVDLCGHATLASAHVLWESGRLAPGEAAIFTTRSGKLTAIQKGSWIEMDFPATESRPVDPPAGLLEALQTIPLYVGSSRSDYLIEVASEQEVRQIRPNFDLLRQLNVRGVIVTSSPSSTDYDFVSRFFAPGAGIDEDPVTGSAHCTLAPFWAARTGRLELVGYQASRRGGIVRVRVAGDRVWLGGQATTVFRGELAEPAVPDAGAAQQ